MSSSDSAPDGSSDKVKSAAPEPSDYTWTRGKLAVAGMGILLMAAALAFARWDYVESLWQPQPQQKKQQFASVEESAKPTSGHPLAPNYPGIDFDNLLIPTDEIHSGGPPKDGIPALSKPKFLKADEANYLQPEDRVIGVVYDEEARAYPLKILNYHEIVNDRLGELPIAVTYCPLCDSAAVLDRRTDSGEREFGVSGMLYNSNVLMYDRSNPKEALFSQLMSKGISGVDSGKQLSAVPMELTTWEDWRQRYPESEVLSTNTGHQRSYSTSPYERYFATEQLMFPVGLRSDRFPNKTPVLGVWTGDVARAYPLSAFSAEKPEVQDTLDGKSLTLRYNPGAESLRVVEADEGLEWMYSLWFAWYAFSPETEVYEEELEQ